MPMKMYAYPAGDPLNEYGLLELKDVSFSADAKTIREIARFLNEAADEMEKLGSSFDHIHMQDKTLAWQEEWPDLVVCRPVDENT